MAHGCGGGGSSGGSSGLSKPGSGAQATLTSAVPGQEVAFEALHLDTGFPRQDAWSGLTPDQRFVHGCGDGTLTVTFEGEGCAEIIAVQDPGERAEGCGPAVDLEVFLPGNCLDP